MASERGCRKDKNQNIQVFVRLRPLNQRERDIKSLGVVEVLNNREVVVRQSQQTSLTKKFTFDRAFAPHAKQVEVYQDVVSPLIEEVLAGYNCTVFAYGQTGTGKTHTMVGEHTGDQTTWQNDPLAGIIPRALSQLFDELRISNTEYTVRVSYLELYNEELFDLLSTSEDNSKLRIYEDVTRKGSNIVNGLEEITVYNKNEVYKIMAQGQERKRVASTLMNAQSSRSHTVFTIVVHMKENSPEGEELVKIGKLNLVDLAGSENISKAGSDNPAKRERARECVNINQSLLTLGRVITALVERHPHIPYRESKLTRILQESLGGRTKTSIIATISPGHKDLEETMSTLEYAHRAKNIQNKPEVNQKMTKKAILKEFAEEIDKLKRDLQAARDKNGVYLANETFTEMTLKQEEQRKEIQELLLKKRAMEEERDKMENVFTQLNHKLEMTDTELNNTKSKLNSTQAELVNTNNVLRTTKLHFEEQKHLVSKQRETEHKLSQQATQLVQVADLATTHVACLHDTVDKRRTVESSNLEVTRSYRRQAQQQRRHVADSVSHRALAITHALDNLQTTLNAHTTSSTECQEQNKQKLDELVQNIVQAVNEMKTVISSSQDQTLQSATSHRTQLHSVITQLSDEMNSIVVKLSQTLDKFVSHAQGVDVKGNVANFVNQWYSGAVERVSSLRRSHVAYTLNAKALSTTRAETSRKQRDARKQRLQRRGLNIQAAIAEIEEEKALLENRLSQQLADIELERQQTEARLNAWIQQEKQLLEERLAKKITDIEREKKVLEERINKHLHWHQSQLQMNEEEMELADGDLVECERSGEECVKSLSSYGNEFELGASAISTDMEVFSANIVEVVEHINNELLRVLNDNRQYVQKETSDIVSKEQATLSQLKDTTDVVLSGVVQNTNTAMDNVVQNIEATSSSTISSLTALSTLTSDLITCECTHVTTQSSNLDTARRELDQLSAQLTEAVNSQAQLEARYLDAEYTLYSPTGKTPVRSEYRYPRHLAATSPHDRILARFRAMRQNSNEDECAVVESDGENRQTSDSESSSVSEDSAVAFAAPSPPDALRPQQITKCTSETDIYAIRKKQQEQGKENTDRPVSLKKPSKLPAPQSHKKPLVERNGLN